VGGERRCIIPRGKTPNVRNGTDPYIASHLYISPNVKPLSIPHAIPSSIQTIGIFDINS
jgi:hypothetical protein